MAKYITKYIVCGEREDIKKIISFADVFLPENRNRTPFNDGTFDEIELPFDSDRKKVKRFISCLNVYSVLYGKVSGATRRTVSFTIETEGAPKHDLVDAFLMAATGKKMKYFYMSSRKRDGGDCATNDADHIFF